MKIPFLWFNCSSIALDRRNADEQNLAHRSNIGSLEGKKTAKNETNISKMDDRRSLRVRHVLIREYFVVAEKTIDIQAKKNCAGVHIEGKKIQLFSGW